jgi:hypothetical protein
MADSWAVELPIHPTAVGEARRVLRDRFADEMSDRQLEDAELVVSELVGQAFMAGPPLRELRLTGDVWDGGVRLTVQDDRPLGEGGREPMTLIPGTLPHRLVTGLSEAFGEIRVNDVTIVWCELPLGEPGAQVADAAGTRGP